MLKEEDDDYNFQVIFNPFFLFFKKKRTYCLGLECDALGAASNRVIELLYSKLQGALNSNLVQKLRTKKRLPTAKKQEKFRGGDFDGAPINLVSNLEKHSLTSSCSLWF